METTTNRESWAGLVGVDGAAGEGRTRGRVNEGHAERTQTAAAVFTAVRRTKRRYTYNRPLNWAFLCAAKRQYTRRYTVLLWYRGTMMRMVVPAAASAAHSSIYQG